MHKRWGNEDCIVHRTKSFHQSGISNSPRISTFNPWELNQLSNCALTLNVAQESKAAVLQDKLERFFRRWICTPETHATFANSTENRPSCCVESIGQSEMIISVYAGLIAPAAFRGWIRSSEMNRLAFYYCSIQHATDQTFGSASATPTSNNKLDSLR